jgi:hypothetical protein
MKTVCWSKSRSLSVEDPVGVDVRFSSRPFFMLSDGFSRTQTDLPVERLNCW